MKKYFIFLSLSILLFSAISFAQIGTTTEVPKNYKPTPKELLPMPDSLTTEMIFPVLGAYSLNTKNGDPYSVMVIADSANTGIVWVEGLPQGRFRAELRSSPSTYKIPAQDKIKGGTMILNDADSTLYVNVGTPYNEEKPSAVFPNFNMSSADIDSEPVETVENKPAKKKATKSTVQKSIIYTGKKTEM